jgi:anthranilate phosphoribosyltransferase
MKRTDEFGAALKRVAAGHALNEAEATQAFTALMSGTVSPARVGAFLTALAMRHASIDELVGGARVMREAVVGVEAPPGAIDVCGTGGDGQGTLNVSTAAALVVAGSGVPVAKHGNRAMSSRTGSADVLEALGVHISLEPGGAEACLRAARICFMFAQAYHPAMKHVAPIRQELGFRTIFNLLGPLSNPAHVKRQLIGVYDESWLEPFAHALKALGAEKAWIVHGQGLDELALSGVTKVAALENGDVRTFEITPEDVGLARAPIKAIKGGTAEKNAEAIRSLLRGARGPFRDIVVLNAAAALVVADKVQDLRDGIRLAAAAIDEGAAEAALNTLIAASREVAA